MTAAGIVLAVLTASARRATTIHGVHTLAWLCRNGWSDDAVRAQLDALRWRRYGRVVVHHAGPPTPDELRAIALLNCGPRAALTAFAAGQVFGLQGWERPVTDVIVPSGTHVLRVAIAPVRVHYTSDWPRLDVVPGRRLHRCAPALIRAASTFAGARPACGILAAGVQQQLVLPDELGAALAATPRVRHHRALQAAIGDIEQGAQALSEIDFGALCRRHALPAPVRQAPRVEPSGRRRYLDVEWRRFDGRRVVAEIDGALHLAPRRWWDDQLRQNEVAIAGDLMLRFPSVVVRTEASLVADQVRRALLI